MSDEIVKRLRHRPHTAAIWVRFPFSITNCALLYERVAKLVMHLTFNQEILEVRALSRSPIFEFEEIIMALMGQYEYAIDSTHPRANKDGQVYLHVVVAEEKLGRCLLPGETVHHRDFNKLNNDPNNLIVFATKADHTRFHKFGCDESFLERTPNGSYRCKEKIYLCLDCGTEITRKAKRCVQCSLIYKRCNHPTKQQLEAFLVNNNGNFSAAGREYGVTGNAIKKWCLQYGLPVYSGDYKLKQ